jgi:hypothetical protein
MHLSEYTWAPASRGRKGPQVTVGRVVHDAKAMIGR